MDNPCANHHFNMSDGSSGYLRVAKLGECVVKI